jgi:hypothetical protein
MATRNPKWSRDELIVTLNFYLLPNPSIPDKRSSEILELSDFLNRLQIKLGGETGDKFRNPNGVYMKLMNFRRFDPSYEGKGLERVKCCITRVCACWSLGISSFRSRNAPSISSEENVSRASVR